MRVPGQKDPPKNTFSLKFQMFDIFLVLKQVVTLLKYKYLKTEEKINQEVQQSILSNQSFFRVFLEKFFLTF